MSRRKAFMTLVMQKLLLSLYAFSDRFFSYIDQKSYSKTQYKLYSSNKYKNLHICILTTEYT